MNHINASLRFTLSVIVQLVTFFVIVLIFNVFLCDNSCHHGVSPSCHGVYSFILSYQ